MLRRFYIDRLYYNKFAISGIRKSVIILITILSLFIMFLASFSKIEESKEAIFKITLFFIALFFIQYFFFLQKAKAFRLFIDAEGVSLDFDMEKFSFFGKVSNKRSERRSGSRLNQNIKWKKVEKVIYSKKNIKVYDYDYDFLNGNGKIVIPKYISNFSELEKNIIEFVPQKKIKK